MDIIQSIVYGFGVMSQKTPSNIFSTYYETIYNDLNQVISNPKAFSEDNIVCTECAIAAFGKLGLFQPNQDLKIRENIVTSFLSALPLKNEAEEAQNTHLILLKEVLNKNEMLCKFENNVSKTLNDIKNQSLNNPEMEILNDEGRKIISQLLA